MGSGPSNPEPRVLRAMAQPPLAADDPALTDVVSETVELIRATYVAPAGIAFPVPGASRAGLEAVMSSLVGPGDRVLVGAFGHFGNLLVTLAERAGAEVDRVDAEWGSIVDPDSLTRAVRRRRPKLVAIVHADTSTGILQPLDGLGDVCREVGALLMVDAVLSLGGAAIDVDRLGVDAAVGGLQKCLGGPPGMAPIALSDRAWAGRRQGRPVVASLDLERLEALWCGERSEDDEVPVAMLYGLREALHMIQAEGLTARWERHLRAGEALAAGVEAMGLDLVGDRSHKAPMIALVSVPEGVSEPGVRDQLLSDHGVEIMAAFGPLRGRVWRIGTMGFNARLDAVLTVLGALEAVLASRGARVAFGEAVAAARTVWASRLRSVDSGPRPA
jgi:(S)-ureidoglycine---glyoxylate transaminase